MDNLTHSLVGAALGRAGLYRRTRYAAGALILGANLPDIDVIGLPFGENLAFRRGITHGPIAMMLLPLVLTGLLLLIARWRRHDVTATSDVPPVVPSQLVLLSYMGVWSHPALDWLNSYGVRLLHPFSDRWFYGDSIFIIDPWIWIALGTGVWMSRRRARKASLNALKPARRSLVAVGSYVAMMIAGTAFARSHVHEQAIMEGRQVESVMAAPVPLNPFARTVVIDYGNAYRSGNFNFAAATPKFSVGTDIPDNAQHPAVERAVATGVFDDFLYWSRFPFFEIEQRGDSTVVRLGDARFPGRGGVSNSFSQSTTIANP